MVGALFDTNIIVDLLNGVEAARTELARHSRPAISTISWIEVMVGAAPDEEDDLRRFLDAFERVELDQAVSERAVTIRKSHRLKLPDAVIWASAQISGRVLVTRDVRDFPENDPGVRAPYRLG